MDLPIRLREQRSQVRDLAIARMAHLSYKHRHSNSGYWRECWYRRPGGGCLLHRLRWVTDSSMRSR